jgi:hypothetical protein
MIEKKLEKYLVNESSQEEKTCKDYIEQLKKALQVAKKSGDTKMVGSIKRQIDLAEDYLASLKG